jgi:hypothetical protein
MTVIKNNNAAVDIEEVDKVLYELFVGERPDAEALIADPHNIVVDFKKKSRWRNIFGKWTSLIYSLGCGVTAAAALATLVTGPLFFILAALLGLSTTYANYRMTNHDVSNIFEGGVKGLFKKKVLIETEGNVESSDKDAGPYLPPKRILMLSGGIILSLAFGTVFGALTYSATLAMVGAFTFLGAISVALPPVGIVLGLVTFICLSSLMIKAFSDLVKTENLKEKIKKVFTDLFYWNEERDTGKSRARFLSEKVLMGVAMTALVVGTLGLIFWGQYNTLSNCASAFSTIVAGLIHAPMAAINILSTIVGCGCALAAQIPFILKYTFHPILHLFSYKNKNAPAELKHDTRESNVDVEDNENWYVKIKKLSAKIPTGLLVVAAAFSAAASGVIAIAGQALNIMPVLAALGAFINGFLSNVVNALISAPVHPHPHAATAAGDETNSASNTLHINHALQQQPVKAPEPHHSPLNTLRPCISHTSNDRFHSVFFKEVTTAQPVKKEHQLKRHHSYLG